MRGDRVPMRWSVALLATLAAVFAACLEAGVEDGEPGPRAGDAARIMATATARTDAGTPAAPATAMGTRLGERTGTPVAGSAGTATATRTAATGGAGTPRPTSPAGAAERTRPVLARPESDLPTVANQAAPVKPANLQFILDASGSMNEPLGGTTKAEAARQALAGLVSVLPARSEQINVGLRLYAHVNTAEDERSCRDSELLVPMRGVDREKLREQITAYRAVGGRTPMAYAVGEAAGDFQAGAAPNVIILISDGKENCHADPVRAIKEAAGPAAITVHVVGFGIGEPAARDQLAAIAAATGGLYVDAPTPRALAEALQTLAAEQVQVVRYRGDTGQFRVELPDGSGFFRWKIADAAGQEVVNELGSASVAAKIKGTYLLKSGFYTVTYLISARDESTGDFQIEIGPGQESVLRLGAVQFISSPPPLEIELRPLTPVLGHAFRILGDDAISSARRMRPAIALPAGTYQIGARVSAVQAQFGTVAERIEVKPNTIVQVEI